jgi:hypothetical protein
MIRRTKFLSVAEAVLPASEGPRSARSICDAFLLAGKLQLRPQRRVLLFAPFDISRQMPRFL